jgi:hypothetical protein
VGTRAFFAIVDDVDANNFRLMFRSLDWDIGGKAVAMRPGEGLSDLLRLGVTVDRIRWVERSDGRRIRLN